MTLNKILLLIFTNILLLYSNNIFATETGNEQESDKDSNRSSSPSPCEPSKLKRVFQESNICGPEILILLTDRKLKSLSEENRKNALKLFAKIRNEGDKLEDNYYKKLEKAHQHIWEILERKYYKNLEQEQKLRKHGIKRNTNSPCNFIRKTRGFFLNYNDRIKSEVEKANLLIRLSDDEQKDIKDFYNLSTEFKDANNKYTALVTDFLKIMNG